MKCRAWIYSRLATAGTDPTLSFERQVQPLIRYAAANGMEFVGGTQEIGSGLTMDRPALDEVLRAAEAKRYDTLLIQNVDLLCRDARTTQAFIQQLEQLGVSVETPSAS